CRVRCRLRCGSVPESSCRQSLQTKTKRPPKLAAHSSEAEPEIGVHPLDRGHSSVRAAQTAKLAPCCCLCKCMGGLFGKAQVHPGFSGFEKVDLPQVDVHRHPRIATETRLGLDPT